ncbi:MAG: fibronectin type III domain-containing protein [Robinsoniella sp.]|nr:fibronectin type III domain-containing protein [Robinsoniella sp.]
MKVANAQVGRTKAQMGYTEAWCADFVYDCARLAGISEKVIPYNYQQGAYVPSLYSYMINNCGAKVVSSPRAGDIAFYKCSSCGWVHVAIVADSSGVTIEGNYTLTGNNYSQVVKNTWNQYYDQYGHAASKVYVRPNYSAVPSDTTPPVVKNIYVENWNVGSLGFVVVCDATDNVGIATIGFDVWTEQNGRDDVKWFSATIDPVNHGFCFIELSRFGYQLTKYVIRAYVTDKAGNCVASKDITLNLQSASLPSINQQTISNGTYTLKHGSTYMNVSGSGSTNGTPVVNNGFNGTSAQKMRFEYQGNGNYLIYPECANGKVLDVYRGSSLTDPIDQGDYIDIYTANDSPAQLFKVVPMGNGTYVLELASKPGYAIGGKHNYHGSKLYLQKYTSLSKCCQWTICNTSGTPVSACVHKYTSKITKAATCTTDGVRTYTCSLCGKSYTETIKKTGHNYTSTVTKAATCTTDGVRTYTCSRCKGTYTETIPKTGHNYTTKVVAPTYEAEGYTLHSCTKCSYSYKDTYRAKLTVPGITNFRIIGRNASALRLGWDQNVQATGYIVYQAKDGKWVRIATVKGTEYRVSGLGAGTEYRFAIKAYKTVNGKNYYSAVATLTDGTNPLAPRPIVTATSRTAIQLSWAKVPSATGYILYQYKGGKWTRIRTLSGNTFTVANLNPGTTYQFLVRSYKTLSGKNYYSVNSNVANGTTKY